MARVCQVTGKAPMVGHRVSHANNKTKRRFMPNLQYRRFWVESENRWVRLRLTAAGLRTVDKLGIDADSSLCGVSPILHRSKINRTRCDFGTPPPR